MNKTFTFEGRKYPYFHSGSERTIEVPITIAAVNLHRARGSRILEVGRVLPRYYKFTETVVDKFEGPIREDILTYQPTKPFDLIISISTVEHIWWDDASVSRTAGKATEALKYMLTLLAPDGEMLCTWPIGYNRPLDLDLFAGKFPTAHVAYMRRTTKKTNQWAMSNKVQAQGAKYKEPFPAGNVIAIVRWRA